VSVGTAVGGTSVLVGVGGTAVSVGTAVAGIAVSAGMAAVGAGVSVAGTGVSVGVGVFVGVTVGVGVRVGVCVGGGVAVGGSSPFPTSTTFGARLSALFGIAREASRVPSLLARKDTETTQEPCGSIVRREHVSATISNRPLPPTTAATPTHNGASPLSVSPIVRTRLVPINCRGKASPLALSEAMGAIPVPLTANGPTWLSAFVAIGTATWNGPRTLGVTRTQIAMRRAPVRLSVIVHGLATIRTTAVSIRVACPTLRAASPRLVRMIVCSAGAPTSRGPKLTAVRSTRATGAIPLPLRAIGRVTRGASSTISSWARWMPLVRGWKRMVILQLLCGDRGGENVGHEEPAIAKGRGAPDGVGDRVMLWITRSTGLALVTVTTRVASLLAAREPKGRLATGAICATGTAPVPCKPTVCWWVGALSETTRVAVIDPGVSGRKVTFTVHSPPGGMVFFTAVHWVSSGKKLAALVPVTAMVLIVRSRWPVFVSLTGRGVLAVPTFCTG